MPTKKYGEQDFYERKLKRVMARLEIPAEKFDWSISRSAAYVEFHYKGSLYRFEDSFQNAEKHGVTLTRGSDCFARLVLALEDLARLVENGIYDLQTWVVGLKFIPQNVTVPVVPSFFKYLGFDMIPASVEDVEKQYKKMAKVCHPDAGGDAESFQELVNAKRQALAYFEQKA